jgi:hypothetical protein
MGPRRPADPRFTAAVRRLARRGLTYAEIERELQLLTAKVGRPAPSYSTVRRIALATSRPKPPRDPYADDIAEQLLAGRMPRMYRRIL